MQNLNFYSSNEVYAETYYQLPKIFFTNNKYKKMSSDAKIAYALLKDRFNYSIKNNWCDEENHIYFVYTVKDLQKILGCGTEKITKIKKELEQAELLHQKRMGLNKPNRLYLLKPIATAQDVYLQTNEPQSLGNSGISKIEIPDNRVQSLGNNGISKIEIPKNKAQSLDNSGISIFENNLYKEKILDTIDTIDTEKERLQQQLLLDQFPEVQENTFLNKDSLKFIAAFSNTIQEAHEQVGTIIRAKTKAEKDYNVVLIGEDYQEEIDKCLRRVMHKIKTDATVKSPKGLFYKSFYNLFVECAIEKKNQLNQNKIENRPQIVTHNWIENQ
ncbi:replication initiator protein A [Enterococcus faecalis]|uniref:replication initiator protein A n=1 Tax=Enterococcus faecalis TaxID=1351 RepID=UPI0021E8B643|nr:replication initiator protein A [Enterococcus faecalis]MCV3154087.1 replication initiator protein A [Enterococcus faecalis]